MKQITSGEKWVPSGPCVIKGTCIYIGEFSTFSHQAYYIQDRSMLLMVLVPVLGKFGVEGVGCRL
jgi:hypothetical protein